MIDIMIVYAEYIGRKFYLHLYPVIHKKIKSKLRRLYFEYIIITQQYKVQLQRYYKRRTIAIRFFSIPKSVASRNDAPSNSWQRATSTGKGRSRTVEVEERN